MNGEYWSRRSLVKKSASFGGLSLLSGCSSPNREAKNPTTAHSSTETDTGATSSTAGERPATPTRTEIASGKPDLIIDEWYGTLELGPEQPFWIPDKLEAPNDGNCYILEYDVSIPSNFLGEKLDVALIGEFSKEEYVAEARDERLCIWNHCLFNKNELENFEGNRLGIASAKVGDKAQYKRILLPNENYWLVFDATDVWSDESDDVEIEEFSAEVSIRVIKDEFYNAERSALESINGLVSDMPSPSEEPSDSIDHLESLANDICVRGQENQVSESTFAEFERDISKLRQLSSFTDDIIRLLNEKYTLNIPTDLTTRLEVISKWGATALPIAGSILAVYNSACELKSRKKTASQETIENLAKTFLMNIFFFIVDVIFIWFGGAGYLANVAVELADDFFLAYLRHIAGDRVYTIVLKQLSLVFEEDIQQALDYVERKTQEISNRDEWGWFDTFEELSQLNDDNIDDWKQLEFLLDDRSCGSILAESKYSQSY